MPKMGFLETTSSFNKKLETSYNDIHLIYENQMLRLKEGHGKILQNAVDTYEKKLVENRLKIEKLSNENSRLKSDKKLITQGFEKKIELLEKEKTAITNDKLKSLREFDSFSQLKKIDPRAFQRLEIDVVDVVNQHKNAREAERKAEAEKHYREQQRIENERRAALKQKEENHRAWLFNRILERKEGGFSHDLIALSNKSQNTSEKNAIAELLDFRKSEKPVLKNKHFEYRLQEIRSGNLNGLDEFTHAIQWATNGGVIDTIFRFNLDSNTDWNDERAGKEVFNLFENISTVIEKELEKTKYSEVEKIKKLADFGDLVREKTDSLYCDYLQKRLTPFYEREERRKEHLEAMRKIDPNYMRSNSHSEFERNKPKPSPGNDFSM